MAPGGEGNVLKLIDGLCVNGKTVLDIGCGLGGPAMYLAEKHGANIVGIDIEAALIERAQLRAKERGLDSTAKFILVKPGPLEFADESFDVVLSSGAFTQIEDKLGIYRDCLRILKPGGWLTSYEWMKPEGEYSDDMRYWFKLEGLTYALSTADQNAQILAAAGFGCISVEDRSTWYRNEVRREYELIRSELYPTLLANMSREDADHFVENWRAMAVVCEKGEMLQVYSRARKTG